MELKCTEEKFSKLLSVIQGRSHLMREIANELEQTSPKMRDHDSREIWYPDENPKMSMVYVGPNNDIPIPKFDPKIIEKYNNLNI